MQSSKARWVCRTNPCFYLMSFSQPLLQSTRPHGSKAFAQTNPTLRHFGRCQPSASSRPSCIASRALAAVCRPHRSPRRWGSCGRNWKGLDQTPECVLMVQLGGHRDHTVQVVYTYSCWDKICEGSFPDGSLGSAFRVLQWSFCWLWLGQWPDRDHRGKCCLNSLQFLCEIM